MLPFHHLYLHIPFCKHKCGYCDFNAYAGMDRLMPDYVEALERELVLARTQHRFGRLETVYFGGGTPSLLPPDLITRLLRFVAANFEVAPDAEVTLEANPASTDEAKVQAWLEGADVLRHEPVHPRVSVEVAVPALVLAEREVQIKVLKGQHATRP